MRRFILLLPLLLLGAADIEITSLQKQLVNYWPLTSAYLQSSTVVSDRTPYSQTMTSVGGGTIGSDGFTGDDGDNKYLTASVADFRGSDNVGSLSVWFKTGASTGNFELFSSSDTAADTSFVRLAIISSSSYNLLFQTFTVAGGNRRLIGSTTGLNDGDWHNVVVTTNGSRTLIFLDDNTESFTTPSNPDVGEWFADVPNRDNISVGALIRTGLSGGSDGTVGEIRLYDREISSDEKLTLYNQGPTINAIEVSSSQKDLVLDMPFTDGYTQSATVASDRTPYSQHMTAAGTPPTFGPNGVTFNSTNDVVSYTVSDWGSTHTAGSISAWFKVSGDDCYIFTSADVASDNRFFLIQIRDALGGKAQVYYINGGAANFITGTTTGLTDNQLHHIVATTNGSRYRLYIDGNTETFTGTDDGGWYFDVSNRDNIAVGALLRSSAVYNGGTVRKLRIYDREISSSEAIADYNQGPYINAIEITSLQKQLVDYWPLTDGYLKSSTVLSDRIVNSAEDLTSIGGGTIDGDGFTGDSADNKYLTRTVADFRGSDQVGSISVWFKTAASTGNFYLFTSGDTATANQFLSLALVASASYAAVFNVQDGTNNRYLQASTTGLNDGAWHNFIVSTNSSRTLMFLDGASESFTTPVDADAGDWFADVSNRDNISVGALIRTVVSGGSDGTIGEIRIYDRETSSAEVTAINEQGR